MASISMYRATLGLAQHVPFNVMYCFTWHVRVFHRSDGLFLKHLLGQEQHPIFFIAPTVIIWLNILEELLPATAPNSRIWVDVIHDLGMEIHWSTSLTLPIGYDLTSHYKASKASIESGWGKLQKGTKQHSNGLLQGVHIGFVHHVNFHINHGVFYEGKWDLSQL